ncbi:hypothetical protein K1719_016516 [Acacia pycnantha]|nr:hypothetical protein K1719_016516 [Acacia pycnantha]
MDNSDGSHSDGGEPVVKRVRGSTKMGDLVARHEKQREKLHVDFDANKNPIGDQEDKFTSYVGYLARSKVRIVYATWRLVPQKTKELIWRQLLQTYDVPDNKAMYKHLMGQEVSEANKAKQAANKYQHYMSRPGYKKLERRIMTNELEKRKEAAKSDPSIVVQSPDPPPRYEKWKVARLKGDKYINPVVAEVAAKIDSLEQQSSQGSFTPSQRMDILSTAIGKPDNPGCLRGEPRGVSAGKYFGRTPHCCSNPTPELMAKIRAELLGDIMNQVRESKLPCYLAPIHEGYHYSLCVVCPPINTVYWFDSMGWRPHKDIKTMFSNALKAYRMIAGIKCIKFNPGDRPSINKVIEMLEVDEVESLEMPSNPSIYPDEDDQANGDQTTSSFSICYHGNVGKDACDKN